MVVQKGQCLVVERVYLLDGKTVEWKACSMVATMVELKVALTVDSKDQRWVDLMAEKMVESLVERMGYGMVVQ